VIGYVIHHRSTLYDGVRADLYQNDRYAWSAPFIWSSVTSIRGRACRSICRSFGSSRVDATYVCDLVFVVREVISFREARQRYDRQHTAIAKYHFARGIEQHPEVARPSAKTYVDDMRKSFIILPAVGVEDIINHLRISQNPNARPLNIVLRRPSPPLRLDPIDGLWNFVSTNASDRIRKPLLTRSLRAEGTPAGRTRWVAKWR
jgi:hypothetical protein